MLKNKKIFIMRHIETRMCAITYDDANINSDNAFLNN